MRKFKHILLALVISCTITKVKAQAHETMQLALNIEKLFQFKQILADLKNGYQIINKGYGTVKDISEGNFSIHKTFLDGLYSVSPEVRKYRRVVQIIEYQLVLVREYKAANAYFKQKDVFNPQEIIYLAEVYERLITSSLRNIEELTMIMTAGQLRMSDDERLKAIDAIYDDMEDMVMFLRHFNNQASMLALQKQKTKAEVANSQKLHGIKK